MIFAIYAKSFWVFREKLHPSQTMVAMRDLSMGIMLSHLSIAAEELWLNLKIEVEAQMVKKSYKSGAYVATAFLLE